MTFWSKYTPFKYYYLVKKKDQTNRAGVHPPSLNGRCPFKNVFFCGCPPLGNRDLSNVEELGDVIQEVIHYYTLRGKFSSVHPELKQEGIIRVEVGKEGLRFIRDSGAL